MSIFSFLKETEKKAQKKVETTTKDVAKDVGGGVFNFLKGVGNVANKTSESVGKPIAEPLARGGQALTKIQLNNAQGKSPFEGVSKRQLISDAAETGLNFASLGEGSAALAGGRKLLGNILEGGILGGAQGGVESFRNKSNTQDTLKNVGVGAGFGGVLGGVLSGTQSLDAGIAANKSVGEGGYIGGAKATGFPEAQKAGAVSKGVDDKPKFEVDDSQAKFKPEPLKKSPLHL
jgi:hypothetical protein